MYRELIDKSIGNVYQAGIATKILQYMNKIRNESDITQARRWVMELLQNARDLSFEDRPVNVQFILEENMLTFRHDGKAFRVEDILSIINQVSSKNPGDGVGQFGTGFMTTYQLSQRVELHSVLQEADWPRREFRIMLDRSGRTKEEILLAIEENLAELRRAAVATGEAPERLESGFDTEFRYRLENENSRRIAQTGMADLADTILYVLLFSDRIGSVTLIYQSAYSTYTISYFVKECMTYSDGMQELCLCEKRNFAYDRNKPVLGEKPDVGIETHMFYCMSEDGLTLAAEYDGLKGFLPVSERTPKLFVAFPLIGAEEFPFPVVLNDLRLCPNEPRSGISLVDHADSSDARTNQEIISHAVALYGRFVRALLEKDHRGIRHLLRISEWQENKEWSQQWVRENLYQPLCDIVKNLPVLPTADGWIALAEPDCRLIKSAEGGEAKRVRRLLAPLRGYRTAQDETDWYEVFAPYGIEEEKIISLEKIVLGAQEHLQRNLDDEKMEPMAWCSLLYNSAMQDDLLALGIRSGDIAIFPNQNEEDWKNRKLFTAAQLFLDPGIPEVLKDAAEKLALLDDICKSRTDLCIRQKLLHLSFEPEAAHVLPQYQLTELINFIIERSSRNYRVRNFSWYEGSYLTVWREVWYLMLSCGPDQELYRLCHMVWTDKLPKQQRIEDDRFQNTLWGNSYRGVLAELLEWMAQKGDKCALQDALAGAEESGQFYDWLNCCYEKMSRYLPSGDYSWKRIMLNQKGELRCPYELRSDHTDQGELKEIADRFRELDGECDVYGFLLDQEVSLRGWNLPVFSDSDLTMRVNRALQKLLSERNLSQADMVYQEACTRLLGWIKEHPDMARDAFPNYWKEEDQMQLLTPSAAVGLQRKANTLERMCRKIGTDDPEELMRQLEKALETKEAFSGGMWEPDEMDGLTDTERQEAMREIGCAGEAYVHRTVQEYFLTKGYEIHGEENGRLTLLAPIRQEDGREVEIVRPDTDTFHQAGWDIRVSFRETADRGAEIYYMEVKTHTTKSAAQGTLQVSNEQMKLAAKERERYILFLVEYDFNRKSVTGMQYYMDLIQCLAEGKLYHEEGKYHLRVSL